MGANVIWCDVETTGLDTENAGAFQIAFIGVTTDKDKKSVHKRMFFLNPLSDKIVYNEESGKIHGISEDEIRSYCPESEIIPNIAKYLEQISTNFGTQPKMLSYFCGYNPCFDWKFLDAAFKRHGYKLSDYCSPNVLDVMEQAKKAVASGRVNRFENLKLTTVAKSMGVNMENAHDALCDINATREVSGIFAKLGINLLA